jgi:hypothetical protein
VTNLVDGGGVCSGLQYYVARRKRRRCIKETSSFRSSSDEGVSGMTIADGSTSFCILGSQTRRCLMSFSNDGRKRWVTYSFCLENSRSHDVTLKSRPSYFVRLNEIVFVAATTLVVGS